MQLSAADFGDFFRAVHDCDPFPWQQALVNLLAKTDEWPDVLDLPTGSGKTAALDAAVFHLALRHEAPSKAALRIAMVVDRRLVVDDTFRRARRVERALSDAQNGTGATPVVAEVARRLQALAGNGGPPLVAQRLRGGTPLEHDWARTPTQPTVLCSTVDQVGSRLLFRGYGVSDRMKPLHAGLLGTDSLILLDEAHLAEPFRQTLGAVRAIGRVEAKFALLSATPGIKATRRFGLTSGDRTHPELRRRLEARKPAALKNPIGGDLEKTARKFASEARDMAERLRDNRVTPQAVGVIVNRVALARAIFEALEEDHAIDSELMIGRSRSVDRDAIADRLAPFRTGEPDRSKARPLVVVSTQCLEVGVDLDLDGLVVQAASLDALRQRFGRLNRAGRRVSAEGAIIPIKEDIASRTDDPIYGDRIRRTWECLRDVSVNDELDFGVEALQKRLADAGIDPDELASERPNAPVLMPAYVDQWSQTSPRPTADPDIGPFLHGAQRRSAGVSVVWRSDISEHDLADTAGVDLEEIMQLVPPRAAEAIELPIWVARSWLLNHGDTTDDPTDVPEREPESDRGASPLGKSKRAYRWAGGDDPSTGVVDARNLRPGDLLIVPAEYGGCDSFGWAPKRKELVTDVADEAARPYWGRRCAVRIAPGTVCSREEWPRVSAVLGSEELAGADLADRLLEALPSEPAADCNVSLGTVRSAREALTAIRNAKGPIDVRFPYSGGREGGAILVARRGTAPVSVAAVTPATEDDTASNSLRRPVDLDDHVCRVARIARSFAQSLGIDDVADDLELAAFLHDAGKADPRFQSMLAGGGPWNRPGGPPQASSGQPWSPQAWKRAELPPGWRHEALSVRMAMAHPRLSSASDRDLVLWLVGSHHGRGRPFFEFLDPAPRQPLQCLDVTDWRWSEEELGPQSLAFDVDGFDWPSLFEDLKRRYGIWRLAYLEAILRLADHRAAAEEQTL